MEASVTLDGKRLTPILSQIDSISNELDRLENAVDNLQIATSSVRAKGPENHLAEVEPDNGPGSDLYNQLSGLKYRLTQLTDRLFQISDEMEL